MGIFKKKTKTVTATTEVKETTLESILTAPDPTAESHDDKDSMSEVAPKNVGKLDMVIAFDTTGSMAHYIGAVRAQVMSLIPELFRDNDDLRLGIVAFGDYCDMTNAQEYGDAYQCIEPTNNENELIRFVKESKDTSGGDGDEFYELVLKRIIDKTPWREGSTRSILLIADANPHPLGYTYKNYVVDNSIDWRKEAAKAAEKKIKIDTVTITSAPWYRELSAMTNGVSVPFRTGSKTADLVRASVNARGSMKSRMAFDAEMDRWMKSDDEEMKDVYASFSKERNSFD